MGERMKWVSLYFSQFLSAFADNAVFFALVGILHKQGIQNTDSKMASYQLMFLLAFVILAPIVGAIADRNPKRNVLMIGNFFKAVGTVLLFTNMDPGLAYGVIGIGAVIYSPAKYGILSEFTHDKQKLLTANGIMEGSTIFAIMAGTVVGGIMADQLSITNNLIICAIIYVIALVMATVIPKVAGNREVSYVGSTKGFFGDVGTLLKHPATRFSLFGTASFWMISSVIRIGFLTWLAEHLDITQTSQQSTMVGTTAIGVVVGALIAPLFIKTNQFKRMVTVGFVLGVTVMASIYSPNTVTILVALIAIGVLGGLFVVPMNTLLQEEGKKMIGVGKTIAIQNFIENSCMVIGVGVFKLMRSGAQPLSVDLAMMLVSVLFLTIVGLLSLKVFTKQK